MRSSSLKERGVTGVVQSLRGSVCLDDWVEMISFWLAMSIGSSPSTDPNESPDFPILHANGIVLKVV